VSARFSDDRLELGGGVYNLFDERYGDPGSEEHLQDLIEQDLCEERQALGAQFQCSPQIEPVLAPGGVDGLQIVRRYAVEATGAKDFRGVKAQVGEILAYRNMFWGLIFFISRILGIPLELAAMGLDQFRFW